MLTQQGENPPPAAIRQGPEGDVGCFRAGDHDLIQSHACTNDKQNYARPLVTLSGPSSQCWPGG